MIRIADIKDIDNILILLDEIREVHHKIRPDLFKSSGYKYNKEELIEIINNPLTPIFVYVDNNKLVGYAMNVITIHKDENVLCDFKTLYIDDLCVEKNYRGKNIGHLLFDYVKNYAKEIGCHNVTLNVWNGNDKAIKFYESLGLKIQKTTMEMIL